MTMHNGSDVCTRTIDLAVDKTFEVHAAIVVHDIAVQVERLNVVDGDQRRRQVARQQKTVGAARMTDADVPERVEDALVEQDVIRVDQIRQQLRIDGVAVLRHETRSRQRPSACWTGRSEKLNSTLSSSV